MTIKRDIIIRFGFIFALFALLAIWLFFQLVSLKYLNAEEWKSKARQIERNENEVAPKRGDILDVNGMKIACSVPSYRLYMDLLAEGLTDAKFNGAVDSLALELSRFFRDKGASVYRRELQRARQQGRRYYLVHPRRISYTELQVVSRFPLFREGRNRGGFIPEQYDQRKQPFGSLASRTIGKLYGESSKGGRVGLERAYNEVLRGTSGTSVQKRISGRWVPEVVSPPVDGLDVVTTLDIGIQDVAEHALRTQLQRHNARHGVAILMEVETGAIRAMVNLYRQRPGVYTEDYFNYAIGEASEPGSTFKLAAMMAALEDRVVRLSDSIDTGNGAYRFYDQVMRDSRQGGYGRMSMQEVFEKSSNIGISRLIFEQYKDNPRRFVDRLYQMGLNKPLGIEIDGEGRPEIKYPGDTMWSGTTLPWMAIGYEVKMTPLQILALYNAVANKGKMVKPMFVSGLSRHGRMVERFSPEVLNPSIASRETVEAAHRLLLGVVERGTATNIRNNNYSIAGKTGTAQVAKGAQGYQAGGVEHQASFVGYFPAERPRYSCIVVVASPSNNVYYGNVVAGTVFREIADRVYATGFDFVQTAGWNPPAEDRVYPYAKGGTITELHTIFRELRMPAYKQQEIHDWVSTLAVDSGVVFRPKPMPGGTVPGVIGMGAKDAVAMLENAGLKVHLQGVGRVVSQSIQAGGPIRKGSTIFIKLE